MSVKREVIAELSTGSSGLRWSLGIVFALVAALSFFAVSTSSAQPAGAVTIDRPVVDQVGVLRPITVDALKQMLQSHQDQTGVQIAVLIVETTGGVPIEDYSLAVAQRWGGGAAGRDDGVLVTLAIKDRQNRIEVGYGLEHRLTDGGAAQILQNAVSPLRAGDYDGAVVGIVEEVVASTRPGARVTGAPTGSSRPGPPGQVLWVGLIALALFLTFVGVCVGASACDWYLRARDQSIAVMGTLAMALVIPIVGFFSIAPFEGVVLALMYALVWWLGLFLGGFLVTALSDKIVLPLGIAVCFAPVGIIFVAVALDLENSPAMLALIVPGALGIVFCMTVMEGGGGGGTYSSGGSSSGGGGGGGSSGGGGSFGGGGASGSW